MRPINNLYLYCLLVSVINENIVVMVADRVSVDSKLFGENFVIDKINIDIAGTPIVISAAYLIVKFLKLLQNFFNILKLLFIIYYLLKNLNNLIVICRKVILSLFLTLVVGLCFYLLLG